MDRRVMKGNELIGLERNEGVSSALLVGKFDFVYAGRPSFNDGTDLTSNETLFGEVFERCHDRERFDFFHSGLQTHIT